MKIKSIITLLVSVIAFNGFADTFAVSEKEQTQMREEAENWIDDMPVGLQDRISDAVGHAMHGFYSEIGYFRNMADTAGINKYKVKIEDIKGGDYSDLSMRLYKSENKSDHQLPLLIYFHGGGWSVGSILTTDKFCRAVASEGKVMVVSVDYPLAPEHPYPAALKTCQSAIEFICRKAEEWGGTQKMISLGGDGAGGNLAYEVFQALPSSVKIRSLILYYPLLKTSGELIANNKREYGRGYGFDSRLWEAFTVAYNDKSTGLSKKVIPPTLLISAGRDIIIDEEKNFASGNKIVTYVEFEGALHGFITDGNQPTAFNKAVALTNSFLTR